MDFPSETEDAIGKWLKGKSGRMLESMLLDLGIKPLRDCWITGSLICRPQRDTDLLKSSRFCRPNLARVLQERDPVKVISFGDVANHSILSIHYEAEIPSSQACVGWTIPSIHGNRWVASTYHPRVLLTPKRYSTYQLQMERHLADALDPEKPERPHDIVPDYSAGIEMLFDRREIRRALIEFEDDPLVAFDYEGNMLKPDGGDALLLSASVTSARRTCSFPLTKDVHDYWRRFLRSKVRKTACNIKFEDRWSKAYFGVRVRNWYWCSLQAAHIIQSDPVKFTSLKMQAFILLGQPKYNKRTESLLESNDSRTPNRAAEEIEIGELLKYNGMDTVLEFLVGQLQREILQYDR
jgi:uracil-DNA glycosylase family 4